MSEYPAHTGAVDDSIFLTCPNYKPEISFVRDTFCNHASTSFEDNNMEVVVFRHFVFCNVMAADSTAFCADLDDKKGG
jgi:hypothetical protein